MLGLLLTLSFVGTLHPAPPVFAERLYGAEVLR